MGDMIYLVAGYTVILSALALFVYSLISRRRKLQQEIVTLKQLQQDNQ